MRVAWESATAVPLDTATTATARERVSAVGARAAASDDSAIAASPPRTKCRRGQRSAARKMIGSRNRATSAGTSSSTPAVVA